jgi:hypothetical protein
VGAPGRVRGCCGCGWRAAVRDAGHARARDYADREYWRNKCERVCHGQFEPGGPDGGWDAFGKWVRLGVRVRLYSGRADDHSSVRYDEQVPDADEDDSEGEPVVALRVAVVATAKLGEPFGVRVGVWAGSRWSVTRVPESSLV